MMKIKEFIVYEDGNVKVTAENEDDIIDGIFLHSSCQRLKPSIKKEYNKILDCIIDEFNKRGLRVYATPVSEADEKWIKSYGFKETGLMLEGFKLLSK